MKEREGNPKTNRIRKQQIRTATDDKGIVIRCNKSPVKITKTRRNKNEHEQNCKLK